MEKILEIRDIELDPALQPRAAMDQETIDEYTEVWKDDNHHLGPWPFPPVQVVFDGSKYWLWDGWHRTLAAKNAGIKRIPATIQQGDRDFALWRSVGANKTHGLRRSNADKRRATELALMAAPGRSDREIAYHVGITHPTVSKIRAELAATGKIYQSTERTGADGRTINTAQIGGQVKATGEIPQSERRQSVMCPHCDDAIYIEQDTKATGAIVCDCCKHRFASYEVLIKAVEKKLDEAELLGRLRSETRYCVFCHQPQEIAGDDLYHNVRVTCRLCFRGWPAINWRTMPGIPAPQASIEAQHERNLQALKRAAGDPQTAAQVLELQEIVDLQVRATDLFNQVINTQIIEDLEELVTLLEDFMLDTPQG